MKLSISRAMIASFVLTAALIVPAWGANTDTIRTYQEL